MAGFIPAAQGVLEGIQKARDWIDTPDADLDPLERMGKAGVRSYCRAVQGLPTGGYTFGIGAGVATGYICDPVWNEPGNSPDSDYPRPPFSGGQCEGVAYEARGGRTAVRRSTGEVVSVPVGSWVPIGNGPISSSGWVLNSSTNSWMFGLGVASSFLGSVGNGTFKDPKAVGVEVRRVDGNPDVCGDPPPVYRPPLIPSPYNFGDPIPTGPDTPPVTVPDPTGRDRPGIDIDFGDGSGISLDFGDGGDSGGDGEPPPPDRPEDGGTSSGGAVSAGDDGEYDFGDPPDGAEWVGYRWSFPLDPVIYGGVVGSGPEWISPRVLGNGALILAPTIGDGASFVSDTVAITRNSGSQFRPVGGVQVRGCKFSILPTLSPTIVPLAAPLPPPEVVEI